jgi:hypothetical protein
VEGPQPARVEAALVLELPAADRGEVQVLDVAGRVRRTLLRGEVAAGEHAMV